MPGRFNHNDKAQCAKSLIVRLIKNNIRIRKIAF